MFSIKIKYLVVVLGVTAAAVALAVFVVHHNLHQAPATTKKQLWHCGMDLQVIQDHPGECPICHMALTPLNSDSLSAHSAEKKILYWWDPMLGTASISD